MKSFILIVLLATTVPSQAGGVDSWWCAALVQMGLKAHYVFPNGEASEPRLRTTARIMLTGNRWRLPGWTPLPVTAYGAQYRRQLNRQLVLEHRRLVESPLNQGNVVASLQNGESIPEAFVVVHPDENSQKQIAKFLERDEFKNVPRVILLRSLGYWINEPQLLRQISLPVDWSQDPGFEGLDLNADLVHLAGGNHHICLSQASRLIISHYFKHHPQGGTLRLRIHRALTYPQGVERSIPLFAPSPFKAGMASRDQNSFAFESIENPDFKVVIEIE